MEPGLKAKSSLASLGKMQRVNSTRLPWHAEFLQEFAQMKRRPLRRVLVRATPRREWSLATPVGRRVSGETNGGVARTGDPVRMMLRTVAESAFSPLRMGETVQAFARPPRS